MTDASVEIRAPVLAELSVTGEADASPPLALVPPFSPAIHDYFVRCLATENDLTVSMRANPGNESELVAPTRSPRLPMQTLTVRTRANQAVVAIAVHGSTSVEYWVRCLPPDFPPFQMHLHPDAGVPRPGYYLVGNFGALTENGAYAMVLDGHGVPVWYHRERRSGVCDVDSLVDGGVSYIPAAAWLERLPFELFGLRPFEEKGLAPEGQTLGIHELRRLSNGHYVVIADPVETGVDLTGLKFLVDGGAVSGGPGASIVGCNIVELTASGSVVWEWKALDHLDPAKVSLEPVPGPPRGDGGVTDGGLVFDVLHCNSVDVDTANGNNLLVSMRQTNSFIYIERSSGKILWKMGGTRATLDDAAYIPVPAPTFNGQHDVRLQPGWSTCAGGRISLYDDASYGAGPARGVVYDVALGGTAGCTGGIPEGATPRATLEWEYKGAPGMISDSSGSFRISEDGSRVIGWGITPGPGIFTEVDETGHDLLDFDSAFVLGLPPPMGSYRAIKVPLTSFDLTAMRNTAGLPVP
jgi:hypothetical protein